MTACDTITRKWGNSLGIILPKEVIEEENIKENEKIKILILKQNQILKKTFGIFKGKLRKNTQRIKDELRKELYHA